MDNLSFTKLWQESNLIELEISANSEFASVYQSCYIQDEKLEKIADSICRFVKNYNDACYLEFGNKEGNYTPAFSMCMMSSDSFGHVKIEVDIEIADNDIRAHRCCFFVNSDLGSIERLGFALRELIIGKEGTSISLH